MPGTMRIMVPQLMAERHVRVKDIQRVLGISRPTASKIANGLMIPSKPGDFAKLCELLGARPEEVLVPVDELEVRGH